MHHGSYTENSITAYATGLQYGNTFYAGPGETVPLGLTCETPEGFIFLGYEVSAGAWTEENGAWTLTMPDEDVFISAAFAPVFGEPDYTLPADLTTIKEEAFEGATMSAVLVPANCTAIGDCAFRNFANLRQIRIPAGCALGTDVFEQCDLVYVYGAADSPANGYCDTHDNCVFVMDAQE